MALSNPLHGERKPGYVGTPLPGVNVKIVEELNQSVVCPNGKPGELMVKGPTVFSQYWNRKEATLSAFDQDGYFKTGDIAVCENGNYKILGRASVDIIKSAGYKISALDIERELLEHPNILECAVVGVEDSQYGQIVSAIVVLRNPKEGLSLDSLRMWCKDKIANYKIPRKILVVPSIPRNAMGKVNKKDLVKLFSSG